MLDQEEIEKYWLSVVLPNVDSLVAAPIDLDFQIGEPSWVGFTFQCIFCFLCILSYDHD